MKRRGVTVVFFAVVLASARISRAEFVNFESEHVRPLALSSSGEYLYAVNTPDNRLEVFRVTTDGLSRSGEVVVGLEPVAVQERAPGEVWVVNHLSDSVSVVDVTDPSRAVVKATLLVGDEPRDIVFAGEDRGRAFITTAHRGQNHPGDPELTTPGIGRADVWVFDSGDLGAAPHIITLFADTPRALAVSPDGTRVYAAAFRSGNRTSVIHELAASDDPELNEEIGDGFTGLGVPPLPEGFSNTTGREPPATGVIVQFDGEAWRDDAGRDWSPRMRFDLPDKDVFAIDATGNPPEEIGFASGVGTLLFNMAVHPVTGAVYATNFDARNLVRFEPRLRGNFGDTRLTTIDFDDPAAPVVTHALLNPHIDYSVPSGDAEEIEQSLAFPLGLEFTSDGETLYVAAFSSGKIGVLAASGAVVGRIDVGGGPSGLALDEARGRLYVMNRFDQTISIVDTAAGRQTGVVPLRYNPEPPQVQSGRRFLYDATISSGHGDVSCATCHVFASVDHLAWDLGDPAGRVASNPTTSPRLRPPPGNFARPFHPMKGPMTTQSLRGLAGAGAMHWRGDRNGFQGAPPLDERASFMKFRPAFVDLMGRSSEFPEDDMEKFLGFILTVRYPPNPIAELDGSLTAEQAAGRQIFLSNGNPSQLGGDGISCGNDCHVLPLGTLGGNGLTPWLSQDFKVPHLRNLYTKVGMFGSPRPRVIRSPLVLEETPTPHRGDQIRGFGFRHDGALPTIFEFLREKALLNIRFNASPFNRFRPGDPVEPFQFLDQGERTGDRKARELEAFLLAFDTGLPSHVGQQITITAANLGSSIERYDLLRSRRGGDFVAHGLFAGEQRGFLYDRPPSFPVGQEGTFLSDRQGEEYAEGELLEAIRSEGAILTFTVVPRRTGERIALDRDEDEAYDRDEIDGRSDPADPESLPGLAPSFVRGDGNGDGSVNISDASFLLNLLFGNSGDGHTCRAASDANADGSVNISDAGFLLNFLFAAGPAPAAPYPRCAPAETGELGCEAPPPCG